VERVRSKADVMNRRRDRLASAFAWLSLIAAAVALIGSVFMAQPKLASFSGSTQSQRWSQLVVQNDALNAQVADLARQIAAAQPQPGQTPSTSTQLAKLSASVADISRRQARIEQAIGRDPARALEVPLLRRDVDNIKESQAQAMESMGQRLDQVFDLDKWLLGAGALSLMAIAFSTLLSHWKARGPE